MTSYCAFCKEAAPEDKAHKKCKNCKSVEYCSDSCQKKDWKTHKLVCNAFTQFIAATPRPSQYHRLTLLLPADFNAPKFLWAKGGDSVCSVVEYAPHLGPNFTGPEWQYASEELKKAFPGVQTYNLAHRVELAYRDMFAFDGSKSNLSVIAITNGKHKHDWKGNIMVLSRPGLTQDAHQDVKPADLRVVVRFLTWYGKGVEASAIWELEAKERFQAMENIYAEALSATYGSSDKEKVGAVQISSKADMMLNHEIKYAARALESCHDIFYGIFQPTEISVHMGLPILVRKCQIGNSFFNKRPNLNHDLDSNAEAAILNIRADPTKSNFGFADTLEWETGPVGSVFVARQDKKPITPHQVEALVEFIKTKLSPEMGKLKWKIQDWELSEQQKARKEFVGAEMCRDTFQAFLEDFKKEKVDKGESSWADVISPYAI